MATREEVIAAMEATAGGDIRPCPPLKGWPQLYVRPVLVDEVEIDTDDEGQANGAKDKRTLARGAARVICDEQGVRTFDPKNEADVARLGRQTWSRLQKVLAAAEDDVAGN